MGTLTDIVVGTTARQDLSRLLSHLEQKLAELEQIQQDLTQDAIALALAVNGSSSATPERSVYSIRDAAAELGVSVSMLHKLLRDRRLGHLKVGTRTLITVEHLAAFRRASEVSDVTTPQMVTGRPA